MPKDLEENEFEIVCDNCGCPTSHAEKVGDEVFCYDCNEELDEENCENCVVGTYDSFGTCKTCGYIGG